MPITEQFGSPLLCILLLQVVYFRISGAPSSILWGMNLRATDNRSSFVGTFLTLGSAPLVWSHLQMHSSLESSSQSSDFENLSKNKGQIKAVFESNWPLQKTLNKDEWQGIFHHPGTQYPCIYATPGTRRRSLGKAEWCKDRQKGSFWTQSLTCWRTAPRCVVWWDNFAWIHSQSICTELRHNLGSAFWEVGAQDKYPAVGGSCTGLSSIYPWEKVLLIFGKSIERTSSKYLIFDVLSVLPRLWNHNSRRR